MRRNIAYSLSDPIEKRQLSEEANDGAGSCLIFFFLLWLEKGKLSLPEVCQPFSQSFLFSQTDAVCSSKGFSSLVVSHPYSY